MPKKPEPKTERFTQTLRVQLTTEQIAERASQAAHKLQERDNRENEMKAAVKSMKAVIEELEATLRLLSGEVRDGCTFSSVECERAFDYAKGKVIEIRLDTYEVTFSRPMREDEKQMILPLTDLDQDEE